MTKDNMRFEFVYDGENDVLSIYNHSCKPLESIEYSENIIFDLNKEGNIVGLQVLEASEFFGFMNKLIDRDFLLNLEGIELIEREHRNTLFIVLAMKSKGKSVINQPMPPLRKMEYESPLLCAK